MNVPFVTFQYRDLKVVRVVYLQANRDFQKIITQARKNIFSCGFLHLVHLNEIYQNKLINILDPPDPHPRPPCGLNQYVAGVEVTNKRVVLIKKIKVPKAIREV